jgi:molecular chaperone DnaJ
MVLRVAGRGWTAGDLYVRINKTSDSRFTRAGSDLWREETISVCDAVLGTSLQVPTLGRIATVRVPPGTQPGSVLPLKGRGLPDFGGKGKGDLLLRILIKIPEHLSADEKSLYEQIRQLGAGRSS